MNIEISFMKQKFILKITFFFKAKLSSTKQNFLFKTTLVSLVSSKQMRTEYWSAILQLQLRNFCEFCEASIEESFVYCPECGVELDREVIIAGYHYEENFGIN